MGNTRSTGHRGVAAALKARAGAEQGAGVHDPPRTRAVVVRLDERFGHRNEVGRHLSVKRLVPETCFSGDDHQRRVPPPRVVHHAQAVRQARVAVQLHDGRDAERARVRIGHGHRGAFVKRKIVPDRLKLLVAQSIEQVLLRRTGVAEQRSDAICEQLPKQCEASGVLVHGGAFPPTGCTVQLPRQSTSVTTAGAATVMFRSSTGAARSKHLMQQGRQYGSVGEFHRHVARRRPKICLSFR